MKRGKRVTVTFETDEKTLEIVRDAIRNRIASLENHAKNCQDGSVTNELREAWSTNAWKLREVIGQIS